MSARLFRTELVETDDTGDLQTTKLLGLSGEELSGVHRVSHFGVHSVAPPGSHGVGLALHGERSLVAALGLEHPQYRPRSREVGSTAIYDMHGNIISLVQGNLRIVHGTEVRIVAPKIVLEGEVHLGGDGGELVHRKGDVDSDGDTAVGSAAKVYAL